MRYLLLSLTMFIGVTLRCSGAGSGSFWTISFPKVALPKEAVITEIALSIQGAQSVLVGNLPAHYGVISSNNMSGKHCVEIVRFEMDKGAAMTPMPLSQFLSGVQIRSGPSLDELEKSGGEVEPDRSKKVTVTAVVYFSMPADPKDKFPRRKNGFLGVNEREVEMSFHDIEILTD